MRNLASSAKHRIKQHKGEPVLSVYLKRGAFWEEVRAVRERRGIEARTEIPAIAPVGAYYLPPGFPEEVAPGDEGHEEWADALSEWTGDLLALYKRLIPEDCRETGGFDFLNWIKLLSALVIFDPPLPGLPEFRDALDEPRRITRLMPAPGKAEYGMVGAPITSVGEGEELPGAMIAVKPWHTDKDILNALRIIRATFPDRCPKAGRKKGDLLLDAEIAILYDRFDWSYEEIADHYGWIDDTRVSKYVKRGRTILSKF